MCYLTEMNNNSNSNSNNGANVTNSGWNIYLAV